MGRQNPSNHLGSAAMPTCDPTYITAKPTGHMQQIKRVSGQSDLTNPGNGSLAQFGVDQSFHLVDNKIKEMAVNQITNGTQLLTGAFMYSVHVGQFCRFE